LADTAEPHVDRRSLRLGVEVSPGGRWWTVIVNVCARGLLDLGHGYLAHVIRQVRAIVDLPGVRQLMDEHLPRAWEVADGGVDSGGAVAA
jgi:hypothetical protein